MLTKIIETEETRNLKVSIISKILNCSKNSSLSLYEKIYNYFLQGNDFLFSLKYNLKENDRPFLQAIKASEKNDHVSVGGNNYSSIRFVRKNDQIEIMELYPESRGTILYKDQAKLNNLVKFYKMVINKLKDPNGITLDEISTLFWAISKNGIMTNEKNQARKFEEDEIFVLLSSVKNVLNESNITDVNARIAFNNFFSMGNLKTGYHYNVENNAENFKHLFKALKLSNEDCVLFLARDAISAFEFLKYTSYFSNKNVNSGLIYQPGLPYYFNYSAYVQNNNLEHVQSQISEIYCKLKEDLNILPQSDHMGGEDSPNFNENLYHKFSKLFKVRFIEVLENDEILIKEAKFIYKQFKKINLNNLKKIKIVDLHATGKTIYYVKSVLEYFLEKEESIFLSIDGFVGWGRGENNGLPNIKQSLPDQKVKFSDVFWPFYMTSRDYQTGNVYFKPIKDETLFILHFYHSLCIFNKAIEYISSKE